MAWTGTGPEYAEWFMDAPEELHEKQPMSGMLAEQMVEADPEQGRTRVRFEPDGRFVNYSGNVHGGVIAFMLDETIGVTAFVHVGTRFRGTAEGKVTLYRPLKPGRVFVEARVVHLAKTMMFIEARLTTEAGDLIASSSATIGVGDAGASHAGTRAASAVEA